MKEILHPESQSPNGVKFHFIDIYLDELSKVGGKEVRSSETSGPGCNETTADLTGDSGSPHVPGAGEKTLWSAPALPATGAT